ncbi:hypothetical protein D9615_004818 [Tricholomella constricta]|uniref:Hydrophobic surface binding protein n=1 Tax=Tricholomella constricta TaxID=117010 RepID=A0A8H5HH53_9AGAR|nr:hypothetical protein D9615_004818 [Tricholomella constricta]
MKTFYTFLLLASFVVISFAAVADVQRDLKEISTLVSKLDKTIDGLPSSGATISQGIAIQSDVINLGRGLDKGTSDVKATRSFSDGDSKAIVGSVRAFSPTILHLLNNAVAKKSSIVKIPFPGIAALVRQALQRLSNSAAEFENALIAASADSVKGQAKAIKADIDAAFVKAIAAYS